MIAPDFLPNLHANQNVSQAKLNANTICALIENDPHLSDQFKGLIQKLESQYHIKLGTLVGAGRVGIVFNIIGKDGHELKSCVIRFDPHAMNHFLRSPIGLLPLLNVEDNANAIKKDEHSLGDHNFEATIVLRAPKKAYTPQEIEKSFAFINASGELSRLRDLADNDWGHIDGIPYPIFIDLNAIAAPASNAEIALGQGYGRQGFGADIEEYARMNHLDVEKIHTTKASRYEVEKLRNQMKNLMNDAYMELNDSGIVLDGAAVKLPDWGQRVSSNDRLSSGSSILAGP